MGLFIISVFICVLIIYFNFPISFLLFVPFSLAKYFFKHYSNVKFSPRDKFKNAVVQVVYAQSDRIKDLYAKKMFVSGFYSEFVLRQWLVVVIYSLVNTDAHESGLILHYGIMHIGFNICNRAIGVAFGNPRGVSFNKLLEGTVLSATLAGSLIGVRAGYMDDYSDVTAEDGKVERSFFGDAMTRHHQNNAGYDFNYTDKLGRDFSHAARHSSSEFTEKYLLNSEGGLCSQSPIGSEGRVIDAGKTDECLTQNNITIKESQFGVKRFAKVLDETTTFGSLFNNEFSVNNDNEDFK